MMRLARLLRCVRPRGALRTTLGGKTRRFGSAGVEAIKTLRGKTGAPIKDCKKALEENAGDMAEALEWLRKQGKLVSGKLAGRSASEGLIGLTMNGSAVGAMVELNSETDFASRNDKFHVLLTGAAEAVLASAPAGEALEADAASALPWSADADSANVGAAVEAAVLSIRENISARRAAKLSCDDGVVAGYIHNAARPDVDTRGVQLGQLGVLVAIDGLPRDEPASADIARKVAMHIAAAKPSFVDAKSVPAETLDKEKGFLAEQARDSGKPEAVIEKMVEGRIRKFYQEQCLMEQTFLIYDGEGNAPTVQKMLQAEGKTLGAAGPVTVQGFYAFRVGEDASDQGAE